MCHQEPKSHVATDAPQYKVGGWTRPFLLGAALVCFALAILGVFLPVLPTTPFLLLTSYFLVRSSPKLNQRLLESKFFGPILIDWQQRRGVRRAVKVTSIVMVCIAVAATVYFSRDSVTICAVVLGLAAVGIFVILRLPTIEPIDEK